MKLDVLGIEEIEITDPAGLCNLSRITPECPGSLDDDLARGVIPLKKALDELKGAGNCPATPTNPWIRPLPGKTANYTPGDTIVDTEGRILGRHIGCPPAQRASAPNEKWGVGDEAIKRAGEQVDNRQSKTGDPGQW